MIVCCASAVMSYWPAASFITVCMVLHDGKRARETMSTWQVTKNCLTERSKHMFNNNLISDVKFSFSVKESESSGSEQTVVIPAHKFILAISSPVFFAMFYGGMAESRDIIELPDCNSESFLELLRFLYYDEAKLTGGNVIEILYLAKKYIIPSLSEECSRFLRENVDAQNVFTVLPGVRIYEETSAVEKCWEIVDQETEEVMETGAFLDISHEMLSLVLERDTLTAHEVEIFRAVDRWATHKCEKQLQQEATGEEKRKLLGDAVNLIRFPLMSEEEFASLVPKTNILPKDDTISVFLFFNNAAELPFKFSSIRRQATIRRRVMRFKTISFPSGWCYDGIRPEQLTFSVNRNLRICGVRLFGSQGGTYFVTLEIHDKLEKEKLAKEAGKFETEKEMTNGYHGYDVIFKHPFSLKKDRVYEIQVVIRGPHSHYGKQGQAKVVTGDICVLFSRLAHFSNSSTSVDVGQIPELLFI